MTTLKSPAALIVLRPLLITGLLLLGNRASAVAQLPQVRSPNQSPPLASHWTGRMVHDSASLPVSFDFDVDMKGVWHGSFTSLTQRALEYPLDTVRLTATDLHLVLGDGADVFTGRVSGDSIIGVLRDTDSGEGRFFLYRAATPQYPYRREDVTIRNAGVSVAGSLYIPARPGRHPAIIILQGSGPETRWGTARYLADRFARRGVAALITDKRGTGESTGDWRTATFNDLADDAIASVRFLAERSDIDPHKVGIFGHSQGTMIAALAAAKTNVNEVAFVVAGEPLGDSVYKQDIWRVGRIMEDAQASGMHTADQVAHAMRIYREFVDVARSGGLGYDAFKRAADSVSNQHWFQMLDIPPRDSWVWNWYRPVGNFNPAPYWEQVRVPVMLLYAERDELVPVAKSLHDVERALERGRNTVYTVVMIPDAMHNWSIHPAPNAPFFWWHQAPGINDLVVAWVVQQTSGVTRPAGVPRTNGGAAAIPRR